jgi:membrane-associated phospholipid phosphatase
MKHFFHTLFKNILYSFFHNKNYYFHLLAIVLTIIILESGLDWKYFVFVRSLGLNYFFYPAVTIGAFVPVILPLILIFNKNKKISITGWTLAQAAIVGSFITSVYKAFTGRYQPNLMDIIHDASHSFDFGLLHHGVFWGWPSSHTAIAFAMAFSMIHLYPKNKTLTVFSFLYALYIGIGVSFSVHWLSEFIAGAIMGTVIGITVGKSFEEYNKN